MEYSFSNAIVSFVSIVGILVIAYRFWRELVEEVTRQKLFEIRDELFDRAVSGDNGISFESEDYVLARRMLNKTIINSHKFTWPYLLIMRKFFVCE